MGLTESRYKYEVFDIYVRGGTVSLIPRQYKRTKKPYIILHNMLYPRKKIYISENMYKNIELIDYKMENININNHVIRELLFPDQFMYAKNDNEEIII